MDELAKAIDEAAYSGDMPMLLELSLQIDGLIEKSSGPQKTVLHYWQSNVFAALENGTSEATSNYAEKQLGSLRTAISSEGFKRLIHQQKVQILTNLGNQLTDQGRYGEALEHYDNALQIIPKYALTLANHARCSIGYARLVNDITHQQLLLWSAQRSFFQASEDDAVFENEAELSKLRPEFRQRAIGLGSGINVQNCQELICDDEGVNSLGRSEAERSYRAYCLENTLFLNPINDAYNHSIAATDEISIASIMKHVDDIEVSLPLEFSLFNRIKQEYVTARYLYYEALTSTGVHFSDREVLLADTYDYTLHGIAFEKLRVSYRYAYSVLDRVALLVNHYWSLGHGATTISFGGIWYKKRGSKQLLATISETTNPALRALFELSKDLHSSTRKSFSEPDARLLADLRNALEHRFVEITDDFSGVGSEYVDTPKAERVRIPLSVLESKTMRMLQFARNACIYLPMAINFEEQNKEGQNAGLFGRTSVSDVRDKNKQRWS